MNAERPLHLWPSICLSAVLCAVLPAGRVAHAAGAAPSVWEISPYKIHFMLAFAPEPELTPRLRQQVEARVLERAEKVVGAGWDLSIEAAPAEIVPGMLRSLARLPIEDLPAMLVESEVDKLILAVVRLTDRGGYEIEARDYDLHARLTGSPVVRPVPQRELLADEVFQAVLLAFAPLARIDDVEDKQVKLRLRAGSLPTIDPEISFTGPGSVFRAVRRFNDREGKLRKLMPIEWTLLVVDQVQVMEAEVACTIYSGLRSPLTGRSRGRDERLAMLVRPTGGTTQIELQSRMLGDDPKTVRPLAGYAIYAHPAGAPQTTLIGRTDGDGKLAIPADASPVRILLVKHGGEPLARLPLIPGLEPHLKVEVADDDQRLLAEGIINGFQERFVDLIARRQVAFAQIRARLEESKPAEAKTLLDAVRGLGRQEDLINEIRIQKQQAVSDDRRIQKKIDKLFDDTQEVVIRYLNSTEIDKLESEIAAKLKGG
ncbi:MAG TPA: hypothetical protein VHC22_13175 [Pirellulales bacterium]|nr:hypothetical protein [Pirellulales bacterium]